MKILNYSYNFNELKIGIGKVSHCGYSLFHKVDSAIAYMAFGILSVNDVRPKLGNYYDYDCPSFIRTWWHSLFTH